MAGRWGRSLRLTTTFTERANAIMLSNVLNSRPRSTTNMCRRTPIGIVLIICSTALPSCSRAALTTPCRSGAVSHTRTRRCPPNGAWPWVASAIVLLPRELAVVVGVEPQPLELGGLLAALLLGLVDAPLHDALARRVGDGRLLGDDAVLVRLEQRLVEGQHEVRLADLLDVVERLAFLLA